MHREKGKSFNFLIAVFIIYLLAIILNDLNFISLPSILEKSYGGFLVIYICCITIQESNNVSGKR